MNLKFENMMINNAQQAMKIAKNVEENKKYQEHIDNEPIRQNDKIIELTRETCDIVKRLREDIKKPKCTDYVIIVLSIIAIVLQSCSIWSNIK